MAKRLPDEKVPEFIEAVKKREHLWNPNHDDYKVRFVLYSAWRELSQEFGATEESLKSKWKNLRDIFNKELRKNKGKKLEDIKRKWKHFDAMSFLVDPEEVEKDYSEESREEYCDDESLEVGTTTNEAVVKVEALDDGHEVYVEDFEEEASLQPEVSVNPAKRQKLHEDDYDVMYLNSLVPYFRELKPIRKLIVRSKIHDILLKELVAQNSGK